MAGLFFGGGFLCWGGRSVRTRGPQGIGRSTGTAAGCLPGLPCRGERGLAGRGASRRGARRRVLIGSVGETIEARGGALEQALVVLLRNAFDASPRDAGVTLSIQGREGRIRIEVEDRGAGMSEELLGRAGEPFLTTKEPGRGMGLGLFLVRLGAGGCGAEFSVHSKLGGGTRGVLGPGAETACHAGGVA